MLPLIALALTLQTSDARTIQLHDGALITAAASNEGPSDGRAYKYWSCADTFLDARAPDENFGGSHILQGGPTRTVLIKFGDLNRATNGYRRVKRAKIVLTPSSAGAPQLKAIRRVLVPWGEGPIYVFGKERLKKAPRWSANWRARRAGQDPLEWQAAGATGPADSVTLNAASLSTAGDVVEITGIEDAVQAMVDRWYENQGFALQFANEAEFHSSESPNGQPRLVLELEKTLPPKGPDLSVTAIEMQLGREDSSMPKDGETVTYIARVRNVGDTPAKNFTASWVIGERQGSSFQVTGTLAPGQEKSIELKRTFRAPRDDHRPSPLGLRIRPSGDDAVASNDYLEIYEAAFPLNVAVSGLKRGEMAISTGSAFPGDNAQELLRVLNESVLAESRFSFAPDGALARFRLQRLETEERSGSSSHNDTQWLSLSAWDPRTVMQSLARIGAPSLAPMQVRAMGLDGKPGAIMLKSDGQSVARGSLDWRPGLLSQLFGGSTVNEASIPGALPLAYEPHWNPLLQHLPEPMGLLPATAVAYLNGRLQSKGSEFNLELPQTVLLRVADFNGKPLPNLDMQFYRSQDKDGQANFADGPPAFTLKTSAAGSAVLSLRPGDGAMNKAMAGFGLDPRGVLLIKATANGATEWAWLKAWHLADSFARNNQPAVMVDVRFNLPAVQLGPDNLAANKIAQDSAGTLPAELSRITDGKLDVEVELPNESGAWVEIDLGRDRALGEVSLASRSLAMWQRFEVMTYGTGDTANEAQIWAREVDWGWSSQNRRDIEAAGVATLRYRGPARRARYIRLVCREPGQVAKLAEIRVQGGQASAN